MKVGRDVPAVVATFSRRASLVLLSAAALLSCASAVTPRSPLIGRWSESGLDPSVQIVMTLSEDGSVTIAAMYMSCSGALTIRGTWTATPTTITFVNGPCVSTLEPQPACAIPCGPTSPAPETVDYSLSDDDRTLMLRHGDAAASATWVRLP